MLWHENVALGALRPSQIWLGAVDPHPFIWGFKLAKIAILRRLTTHCRHMQKIGLSDFSKILYNARGTSPLAMGKIKMGDPGRSFGARGRRSRLGCQFWRICGALRRLLRGSGLLDPIVLWGENVLHKALPTCQICLGSVDPSRYGGSNLQKSPFYVEQVLYSLYDVCKKSV